MLEYMAEERIDVGCASFWPTKRLEIFCVSIPIYNVNSGPSLKRWSNNSWICWGGWEHTIFYKEGKNQWYLEKICLFIFYGSYFIHFTGGDLMENLSLILIESHLSQAKINKEDFIQTITFWIAKELRKWWSRRCITIFWWKLDRNVQL